MSTKAKPRATERRRDVWGTIPNINPRTGKKTRIHKRVEMVRSANCGRADHEWTSDFLGVVFDGWAFRCKGAPGSDSGHTFVAEPAL